MLGIERQTETLLPGGWSIVETVDDCIEIEGVELRRAGISATSSFGQTITGSAAECGENALRRACFELLERASLIEALRSGTPASLSIRDPGGASLGVLPREELFPTSDEPERWQPSRSNGVAIGSDWRSACRSAMHELVERDRLLRTWAGEGRPVPVMLELPLLSRVSSYDWQVFRAAVDDPWSREVEVVMIIGFPLRADVPLVRGSAADESPELAVARAERECMQGLGFLWGEEIPAEAPPSSPTPLYHLDRFLWPGAHPLLRRWLDGAHVGLGSPDGRDRAHSRIEFVDLTPPWLQGRFCVVQARCGSARPLFFGDGPAWWRSAVPQRLWAHPIA